MTTVPAAMAEGAVYVTVSSPARKPPAASQPLSVKLTTVPASMSRREDERERVCGAAVVLNDGEVAGGQNGSHQAAASSIAPCWRCREDTDPVAKRLREELGGNDGAPKRRGRSAVPNAVCPSGSDRILQ